MSLNGFILRAVTWTYGAIALTFASYLALRNGEIGRKPTIEEQEAQSKADEQLWSLSNTSSGTRHNFLTTASGVQLHYLTSATSPPQSDKLIVFLHGFPDSSHLWSSTLCSPLSKTATLIALDLPGCGGSDSLPAYGANEMLNTITEGIITLRKTHLSPSNGDVILVGHDWGGLITYRLGAEAPGLASRIVVLNTAYIPHMSSTIRSLLSTARRSWSAYTAAPTHTHLLTPAKQALGLIGTQLLKSNYIFIFQLPFAIAHRLPSVAAYLLSITHRLAHRVRNPLSARLPPSLAAYCTAASNGPSVSACETHMPSGSRYGTSVLARARKNGDWDQRIQIYKQGLASRKWTYSRTVQELLSASSKCPSSTHQRAGNTSSNDNRHLTGSQILTSRLNPSHPVPSNSPAQDVAGFACPATVLFGMKDPALDPRVVLDGIEAYFAASTSDSTSLNGNNGGQQKSHVLRMARCGHWSPVEEEGREVLGSVLRWAVESEGTALEEVKGLGGGKVEIRVY